MGKTKNGLPIGKPIVSYDQLRNADELEEDVEKDRYGRRKQSDEQTCGYLVPNLANTLLLSLLLSKCLVNLYFFYFFAGIVELLFFHFIPPALAVLF